MRVLSPDVIRKIEGRAIHEAGIPAQILMENAGMRVADAAQRHFERCVPSDVLVVCGKGNNGGDGLVAARCLAASSIPVRVALTCGVEELSSAESRLNLRWLQPFDVEVMQRARPGSAQSYDLIIDAMLGTGAHGSPRSPALEWIEALNRAQVPVLAVDVPSGLDCVTGEGPQAVRAAYTVSFIAAKPGFFVGDGPSCCGAIRVEDISIPTAFFADA